MGRFDALTTLDTKPTQPPPLPEKAQRVQQAPPPKSNAINKPASQQTDLHANMQTRKPANQQTGKRVNLKQRCKQTNR